MAIDMDAVFLASNGANLMQRREIGQATAQKLRERVTELAGINAVVGFDGFVDQIISVVDKRHSHDQFDPILTLDQFGRRILSMAGTSGNCELVIQRTKLGGNGPIMANALSAVGLDITYIGNLGLPSVHPVFAELARRATVLSIAEPANTDALEFSDGKLMLNKNQPLADVNWDSLMRHVGMEKLTALLNEAQLIGLVNWTMLPHMSDIWGKLLSEVFPRLQRRPRHLFIDLADPQKRTRDDLRQALELLAGFQQYIEVTLGLNLKESAQVAEALNLPAGDEAGIESTARAIRRALPVSCVVIHPRSAAAAASSDDSASFAGPFVRQPAISTGAGDHFNAGFCLGRVLGLSLQQSLCAGTAVSGYYVRHAASPNAAQLIDFLAELPEPENE